MGACETEVARQFGNGCDLILLCRAWPAVRMNDRFSRGTAE